jgi:hypothetical protein
MNKIIIFTITLLFSISASAQNSPSVITPIISSDSVPLDKLSLGAGGGYEFGGIGGNVIFYPQRNIGVFVGVGWPLTYNIVGYNAGIKIRFAADNNASVITPFILAMYGYNTAIRYPNDNEYDKLFYNFTFGGGVDFRPAKSKLGFLSLTIYMPLRDPDAKNYVNNIELFRGIVNSNKFFPFSVSLGYKFIIL